MSHKRLTAVLVAVTATVGGAVAAAPEAQAATVSRAVSVAVPRAVPRAAPAARVSAGAATGVRTATLAEKSVKKLDKRCRTGRVVCVSKSDRKVYWVVNGKIKMTLDARFGAARTPTRNGTFRVYRKDRNHVSSLYHSKMPFSLFFAGGQAIHYSSDFARRGYRGASHGCVNTRQYSKMKALFKAVHIGDRVVVYRRH